MPAMWIHWESYQSDPRQLLGNKKWLTMILLMWNWAMTSYQSEHYTQHRQYYNLQN